MEVFRSEVKVGLLILVSAVVFTVGLLMVSNIRSLWDAKKSYIFLFPYADGITTGSPVWYAGLEVGEVTEIKIATQANDRISVTVKVKPEARLRKDSKVAIRSLGMMGSKYVEMSPGSPGAAEIPNGGVLEGESPTSMTEVIETGKEVAVRLVKLVEETQTLVHEIRTESSFKEAIQNANGLMMDMRSQANNLTPILKRVASFADSLDEMGKNLKGVTGAGGKDLTALLKELRETNLDAQKRIGKVETELTKTLGTIQKGVIEAQSCVSGVRGVVASSEDDVVSLLKHLNETSKNLESLSEDLKHHPWKVVWKEDGSRPAVSAVGTEQWRDKGRIGPHGKE